MRSSSSPYPLRHITPLAMAGLVVVVFGCVTASRGSDSESARIAAQGDHEPQRDVPRLMTVAQLEARLRADSLKARQPGEATASDTTRSATAEASASTPRREDTHRPAAPARTDGRTSARKADEDTTVALDTTIQGQWITKINKPTIVSVSFLETPLPDVLTLFSKESGLSIVASDEPDVVGKKITGEITAQRWDIAFETLLRAHGLRAVQDSATGIITVQSESRSLGLRTPEIIRLRYVNANDVLPTLQTIVGAGQPGSSDVINTINTGNSDRATTLLVYTSPEKMAKVREMVAKLDKKRPTVTIQAKMVFVNRSKLRKIGFRYQIVSAPTGDGANTGDNANDGTDDDGTGDKSGTNDNPGVQVIPTNPYAGVPGMSNLPSASGSNASAFSLMHTLSLAGRVDLNLFFDVAASVGLAEVEAQPVITTTSDLQAEIQVGEFFILPNQAPILTATGYTTPFIPQNGQFLPGQYPNLLPNGQLPVGQFPNGQLPNGQPVNGVLPNGQVPGGQFPVGATPVNTLPSGGWGSFQTGTTLRVTPYVLPNGRVRMVLDLSRDGGTLAPDGQTITGARQSAKTEVIVKTDEMIVIGGLTVVEKSKAETGIPILKDLPIIGRLFKTTQEAQLFQDLVIVVTPHVIYDEDDDIHQAATTQS